ncbi:MAG TPA: zf-HC2 domain-containing protein [Pyrinomonadaceae bacterium]|nr:zf-HC2 domain-containing protein [Pyrinomonadaceae bacterium]
MNCSFTEKISSLIDGELSTAEAREVERHLIGCHDCQEVRADFLNLRSQLAGFETSLEPSVQNRALKKILATKRGMPARGFTWGFGAQAAAFGTLVIVAAIIGFLIYKSSNTPTNDKHLAVQTPTPVPSASVQPEASPSPNKGNEQTAPRRSPSPAPKKPLVREPKPGEQFAAIPSTPEPARSADTQTMTAVHFEKSETLLVAFRNVRLNEPGTTAEVAYERKRAQQLVLQNMMLRREADAAGDVQVSSLLESLEPILIDISNLPDKPDKDAIRVIRQRVERKNIVPLLRVNSTALARALD